MTGRNLLFSHGLQLYRHMIEHHGQLVDLLYHEILLASRGQKAIIEVMAYSVLFIRLIEKRG
jgi:hypothetical protein